MLMPSTHPFILVPIAFSLSLLLSTTISFLPLVLLLATLLCYVPQLFLFPPRDAFLRLLVLWASLSLALTLSHIVPSLTALSTPLAAIIILLLLSASSSFFALIPIFLYARLNKYILSPWSQTMLFPALWASTWFLLTRVSLLGRLVTWSPTYGMEAYAWLAPFVGPAGYDWITAAWAVIIARTVTSHCEDTPTEDLLIDHQPPANSAKKPPTSHNILVLFAILSALTLPSFILSNLPLPPLSPATTPLSVGCLLPPLPSNRDLSLDDFIKEARKLISRTDVLLSAEGALRFDNSDDRDAGLEKIGQALPGHLIGVGFEEFDSGENSVRGRRRTGLALIHRRGTRNSTTEVDLVYYKRHLVPIAESFSLKHSETPPTMLTLDLPHPSGMNKTDWAPGPNYTRPIPITTSICLDFAWPSAFSQLESRPALILGPAKTWHNAVGVAMWEHAKARANEIGSMVLWCDGGSGGVSGIAGRGMNEVESVGPGSWTREVGIAWPFDEKPTIYARSGESVVLLAILTLSAGSLIWIGLRTQITIGYPGHRLVIELVQTQFERLRKRWSGRPQEERVSLIDNYQD